MFAATLRPPRPAPLGGLPDPVREPEFYAGVATKRAAAWGVDVGVTFLLVAIALPFTGFLGLFGLPWMWAGISFLYRWTALSSGSATLGMRLMAITLRRRDGSPLDPATAFAHTAGYALSWAVFPLQLISGAAMAGLGQGQGLSDMVLGTAAIRRPANGR